MKTNTHPIDYQHRTSPTAETIRQYREFLAAAGVQIGDSPEVVREKTREYMEWLNNKYEAVTA